METSNNIAFTAVEPINDTGQSMIQLGDSSEQDSTIDEVLLLFTINHSLTAFSNTEYFRLNNVNHMN